MNQSMLPIFMQMMQQGSMGGGSGMPGPQAQLQQPQIAAGHQSSITPTMGQQAQAQPPGGIGGAVKAGNNVQQLYGMGQQAYNFGNKMINGTPDAGAAQGNPMSGGAPVANTQAGNSYLQQNPSMVGQQGTTSGNPFATSQGGMFAGGQQQGVIQGGTPVGTMFGPTGYSNPYGTAGQGMNGGYGAIGGVGASAGENAAAGSAADAAGSTAADSTATDAASETPWWDFLW